MPKLASQGEFSPSVRLSHFADIDAARFNVRFRAFFDI
jgi:hypothetical protein